MSIAAMAEALSSVACVGTPTTSLQQGEDDANVPGVAVWKSGADHPVVIVPIPVVRIPSKPMNQATATTDFSNSGLENPDLEETVTLHNAGLTSPNQAPNSDDFECTYPSTCDYDGEKGRFKWQSRVQKINSDHHTPNSIGPECRSCCGNILCGTYKRGNMGRHTRRRTAWKALYILGATASATAASGSQYYSWFMLSTPHTPSGRSALFGCLFTYTVSTTLFYQADEGDEYRDHWLVGGLVGGVSIGLYNGFKLPGLFFNILPWAILVSLLLSSVFHHILKKDSGKWAFCVPEPGTDYDVGGSPATCEKTSAA